jgi:hypothetical protein
MKRATKKHYKQFLAEYKRAKSWEGPYLETAFGFLHANMEYLTRFVDNSGQSPIVAVQKELHCSVAPAVWEDKEFRRYVGMSISWLFAQEGYKQCGHQRFSKCPMGYKVMLRFRRDD